MNAPHNIASTVPRRRRYRADDIKRLTAQFFGLTRAEMESPRRSRRVAWPRQVGMTLVRHYTGVSLPLIGHMFGGRDHTTALHAFRRVPQICTHDPARGAEVRLLCAQIETALAITGHSQWAQDCDWHAKSFAERKSACAEQSRRQPQAERIFAANMAKRHFPRVTAAPIIFPAPHHLSGPRVLLLRGPDSFTPFPDRAAAIPTSDTPCPTGRREPSQAARSNDDGLGLSLQAAE